MLLNSMALYFCFPVVISIILLMPERFLIFLIMPAPAHIYCFPTTSCPHPSSTDIQSTKPLSWRSHSPSTHSILTFILIWFSPPHIASTTRSQGSPEVPYLLHPLAFLFATPTDPLHLFFTLLRTSSLFCCSQNTQLCLNYSSEPQTDKYLSSTY